MAGRGRVPPGTPRVLFEDEIFRMKSVMDPGAATGAATATGTAAPPSELTRYDVAFPLQIAAQGRVAGAAYDDHVAQMIEQVLFTSPGERVNRPEFGCGVLQMVFGPNSDTQAAAAQFLVLSNLQRWLGDVIQPESVTVTADDSRLGIDIQYTLRATGDRRSQRFTPPGGTA
jgi:phage baseplate assembly protein W